MKMDLKSKRRRTESLRGSLEDSLGSFSLAALNKVSRLLAHMVKVYLPVSPTMPINGS